jgi:hypothetical protein
MTCEEDIVQSSSHVPGRSGQTRPCIDIRIIDMKDIKGESPDIVDSNQFFEVIPKEKVTVGRGHVAKSGAIKHVQTKLKSVDKVELDRIALMTINSRIEFCQKYKTSEEEIGKCVCESLRRYIRLSKEARTKTISRAQINAIKNMFEEMKKDGRIKTIEVV